MEMSELPSFCYGIGKLCQRVFLFLLADVAILHENLKSIDFLL